MINFIYNKEIEDGIFDDYVKEKKSPIVADMIKSELSEVIVNTDNTYIKDQLDFIKNEWLKVQDNFLKQLSDFYEKELSEPKLDCCLTRLDIFPYDYSSKDGANWFSAPLFGNPAERNRIIMHELVHYYQPQELPREIKEAIPTILNDHEKFGMYAFDRGHNEEKEQEWRIKIWELYQNKGKFSDLLKLVDY